MKKKFALILLLVIALCSLTLGCTKKLNSLEYVLIDDDTAVAIKGYTDKTTVSELLIPDEIEGLPVTRVDDFGVVNAETLQKITIGKNVKEIGDWAFTNNQNLVEFVVSPENPYFKTVDGVLFTADMKELVFYPSARAVQTRPKLNAKGEQEKDFKGAALEEKYSSYVIPEGVEIVRAKAFYKCGCLDSVTLPSSLKSIGEMAFHKCALLTAVSFPEGLESIGKDAYAYCNNTNFTSFALPSSIKEIGDYAFYNCTSVTSVDAKCVQANVILGEKWYPTDNGRELKNLKVNWING